MMLCSVIIPLYNKAAFIESTLLSVLNQTYQNFEIIVVDDGSKDDGAARVSAIDDSRIRLISQKNAGVSAARNAGIAHAKGEIVYFLDGDDYYHASYLQTVISMASRYPEMTYFATAYRRVSGTGDETKVWSVGDVNDCLLVNDFFDHWRRYGAFLFTGSVAIRRSSLIELQPCFPVGESMGEDHDLWFKLAERYSLVYCPAPLVAYRIDVAGSLCASNQVSGLWPSYARLEQRALGKQLPNRIRTSALRLVTESRVSMARTSLIAGRRKDALAQLLDAWRGVGLKRWWLTLGMSVVCSANMVSRWEKWRRTC
ncbi:glycosyltransferase [Undibacterium parvum]|nr:glycosyltransferase [Undibacterium parvum]